MNLKRKFLNLFFSSEIEEIRTEYMDMFNEYRTKVDNVLNSKKTSIRDLKATLKDMESKLNVTEKDLRIVNAEYSKTKSQLNAVNSSLQLETHNNADLKIVLSTTEEENAKLRKLLDKQKETIEALTTEVSNLAICTANVEAKDKTSSLPNETVSKMFYERLQQELSSPKKQETNVNIPTKHACVDILGEDDLGEEGEVVDEMEDDEMEEDSFDEVRFISNKLSNIATQISNNIKVTKKNTVVSDLSHLTI